MRRMSLIFVMAFLCLALFAWAEAQSARAGNAGANRPTVASSAVAGERTLAELVR